MIIHYLDESVAPSQTKIEGPCLVTPGIRDTFIIELPKLSTRDAEKAACFKARTMYPGPADGAIFSASVFHTATGTTALVHILPKAAIGEGSGGDIGYPIFTPMDLVPLDSKTKQLYIFVSANFVEWLIVKEGVPASYSHVSKSELNSEKTTLLKLAIQDLPGPAVWVPARMRSELGPVESALGIDPKSCRISDYEDAVPGAKARGANAFGPKSRSRQRQFHVALLAIALLDVSLLGALLVRGPLAEQREYRKLKAEKVVLLKVAAQIAEIKKELTQQEEQVAERSIERQDPYSVLEELAHVLPSDCLIGSIDIQGSSFRLNGTAANPYALIGKLEQSGKFISLSLEQAAPLGDGPHYRLIVSGSLRHD